MENHIIARKQWRNVTWCLTEEQDMLGRVYFVDRYENGRLITSFGPTNKRAAETIFSTYPEDKTL